MSYKNDDITISTEDVEIKISKEKLTPEIMKFIGELLEMLKVPETRHVEPAIDKQEERSVEFELIKDRDISDEEFEKYAAKIPSTKKIVDYILSKDNYRHSLRDIAVDFLGIVLIPKSEFSNQQNLYQRLYQRLRSAHNYIQKRKNGEWIHKFIIPKGDENRYKEWWFVEKEQLSLFEK